MRFPWDEMMALGLGRLRLAPRDFWAATPREIAATLPARPHGVFPRSAFEQLLQQFPDET